VRPDKRLSCVHDMHKSVRCPECATSFDLSREMIRGTFSCPRCGQRLKCVPHLGIVVVLSVALSILASVVAGLHGSELWLGTVVFYFPALFGCGYVAALVLPARVERVSETWLNLSRRPPI
jgi:uncharacterized paraquat-inducible protein A